MSRVSSPAFIGREPELERIKAALDSLGAGRPAIFVVAGEAGVGKTRFLHEVAADARARGFRVLEGGCVQLGNEGIPFGPIVEALRGIADQIAPLELERLVGTGRAELARVMPGLTTLPDGLSTTESTPGQAFEHILLFLRRLARFAPLVLLLEDLHWADRTTLDFLLFVARNLREEPIAVIGTYRSDDLHRRHPLRPILAELDRGGRSHRVELRPFDRREVEAQLQGILGTDAEGDLVDMVYARSDGNAFFAEELVAAGSAAELPDTLQDVVLARFTALDDETQELLRTASVAGARFDIGLLAAVSAVGPAAIYRPVREAVDAHILVSLGDRDGDRYAFRHALLQEAIYQELLPSQRTAMHDAFATLLEERGAGTDAGALAALSYHWAEAQDLGRAFEASVRAGLAADAMYAAADARANYERALALWDKVPDAAERSPIDRVDLLSRAAASAVRTSRAAAVGYVREAIELTDRAGDPSRTALLRSLLAAFNFFWNDESAFADSRMAVTLMPLPATPARARALAQLAAMLGQFERHAEVLPVAEEALQLARSLASDAPRGGALEELRLDMTTPRRVESLVLELRGRALAGLGDPDRGLLDVAASRAIAIEIGIPNRIAESWIEESVILGHAGRFEAAVAAGLTGAEYGAAHGMAGGQGAIAMAFATYGLIALGHWGEAAQRLDQIQRVADDAVLRAVHDAQMAPFEVVRGQFAGAARRLARHRAVAHQSLWPLFLTAYAGGEASLALWTGDPLAARAAIGEYLPRLELAPDIWIGHIGPVFALGIWAEADCALLAQRRESEEDRQTALATGRALLEGMRGVAADTAARRPVFSPQADAWLATCEAEATRLEGRSDADRWAAAGAAWVAVGMPYPRAYALMREGQALIAGRGDRARAAEAIRQGSAIAAELGARPLAERLEDLAGRLGMRPEAEGVPAGPAAAGGRYELTRREREILELLAAGRSDGEIAADLFISKKTVSVHINNIKGKLGAESRVGIIRTSAALGLIQMGARS